MNTSAHVDTRSEASAMTDLDLASRPLTAYPHREKVLDLAEQAADAVDRDQASPFTTLQELGDLGLLTLGRTGSLLPQAAVVHDIATRCVSTAFSLWAHRSVIAFFDAVDRPLPEGLSTARVSGTTAMAAAFKDAAGIGELGVRARPGAEGGLILDGVIPWASNLHPGGIAVVPVALTDDEGHQTGKAIVALSTDRSGFDTAPMRNLLALNATGSGFTRVREVHVPARDILTEDVPAFLARISAPFLLLQSSLCLGLAAAAVDSARLGADHVCGVFREQYDAVAATQHQLRGRLTVLAEDPGSATRRDLLQLRLDAAHQAKAATDLELMVVGGRGYVARSATARRVREAAFLPVQSPTEGHLRLELQRA